MNSRIKTGILIISCLFASLPVYATPLSKHIIDYFTNIWNSEKTDKQGLINDAQATTEDMTIIHHYLNQAIDHFNRLNDKNRTHYPKSSLEDIRNDITKALHYLERAKLKNISKLTSIKLQEQENYIKDFLLIINNLEKSGLSLPAIEKNIEKMDEFISKYTTFYYIIAGEIIAWQLIITYRYIQTGNRDLGKNLIIASGIFSQIVDYYLTIASQQKLIQKMQNSISYEDV